MSLQKNPIRLSFTVAGFLLVLTNFMEFTRAQSPTLAPSSTYSFSSSSFSFSNEDDSKSNSFSFDYFPSSEPTLQPTPVPTTTDTVSVISTFAIEADTVPTSSDAALVKLAVADSLGIDEGSILDFSIDAVETDDTIQVVASSSSSSSSSSGATRILSFLPDFLSKTKSTGRRRRLAGYYWNIFYVIKISLSITPCCSGGTVDDLVVYVTEVCTSPTFDENVCIHINTLFPLAFCVVVYDYKCVSHL